AAGDFGAAAVAAAVFERFPNAYQPTPTPSRIESNPPRIVGQPNRGLIRAASFLRRASPGPSVGHLQGRRRQRLSSDETDRCVSVWQEKSVSFALELSSSSLTGLWRKGRKSSQKWVYFDLWSVDDEPGDETRGSSP